MKNFFLSSALLFGAVLLSGMSASAYIVQCNSNGYRYNTCAVTPGSSVQLIQQLSYPTNEGGNCIQGWSWGVTGSAIWVDHGCRANFEVRSYGEPTHPPYPPYPPYPPPQPPHPPQTQYVQCDSNDYQPNRCFADVGFGYVQLVRQDSHHEDRGGDCIQGRTWGYDRRSIWVAQGCRALFQVVNRRY